MGSRIHGLSSSTVSTPSDQLGVPMAPDNLHYDSPIAPSSVAVEKIGERNLLPVFRTL